MNDPSSFILRQFLLDNSLGVLPVADAVWPIYISLLPDSETTPDNAICIFDTAGQKRGRVMDGTNLFDYGNQVMIRSVDYGTGWTKAKAIQDLYESIQNGLCVVGSTSYETQGINQSSPILPLGQEEDGKKRDRFTINFLSTIRSL